MKPIVAIIGRPNVGKSTLFNRLIKRRMAIVHDEPGVTRDRHYSDVTAGGREFVLIDTGGLDPTADDPMQHGIKRQIEIAIDEADVIVCVLDARQPATSIDHAEIGLLRRVSKPTLFVANKADSDAQELESNELYRLGIEDLIAVSALHGRGVPELVDLIVEALPPLSEEELAAQKQAEEDELAEEEGEGGEQKEKPPAPPKPPRIAIVGKPNAGKSSLVNRLLGEERMIVDERPGTTRDAVDSVVERHGKQYVVIDTAGIRRKAKVKKEGDYVETVSVLQAIKAMERCDIVLLMTDAAEGVAEQDAKVLGLAVERGKGIIVGLNKVDALDKEAIGKAETDARDKLSFAPWASYVRLSAKTGRGTDTLLETVDRVASSFAKRVTTGELNRFFERVLQTHPPPTKGGKAPRLYFVTQAETRPPLFVVQSSDPDSIHFSYQRYVQNQIRKEFAFEGVPLIVHYRRRRRRGEDGSTPQRKNKPAARKPAARRPQTKRLRK